MRPLVLIAIIGALFWAYTADLFPNIGTPDGAFAEDGSATIQLFTVAECEDVCDRIKSELQKRGAKYEEMVVSMQDDDENTQRWKELGRHRFPFLVAGGAFNTVANGPEVSTVLAKAFASQYLSKDEKRLYDKHFNDYDEPTVMIYGADWCPYCQKLQKELKANNIPFVELDVPKHRNKTAISKTMDIRGYPSTWVGYHRVDGIDIDSVKATIKVATQMKQSL